MSRRPPRRRNILWKTPLSKTIWDKSYCTAWTRLGSFNHTGHQMKEAKELPKVNCLWWSVLAVTVQTIVPTVWSQYFQHDQNVIWKLTEAKNIKKKRKENYMYQTYKLVWGVFQNTTLWQVLQYLTQLVVRMMFILLPTTRTQESWWTSPNASTPFQKLLTKHDARRKNIIFIRNTYQIFLNLLVIEVLHETA